MQRDFTYVDDIIEGVVRVTEHIPQPNSAWDSGQPHPGSSAAPYRVYNIGNNQPVELLDFIAVIEKKLGKKAQISLLPRSRGMYWPLAPMWRSWSRTLTLSSERRLRSALASSLISTATTTRSE